MGDWMASAISEPKSHGNYLPALEMLLELVAAVAPLMNANVSQTNIFFLSDGRPSDPTARGTGDAIALSPTRCHRLLSRVLQVREIKLFGHTIDLTKLHNQEV